ncbi:sulfatase [Flavobacteriaceae bacterium]|nr:sulfatase [Flavobacteriaceae bacterium]
MKKFRFYLLKFSLLLLLACEVTEEKKPLNVLWLVAEDLSPFYLNAYGDPRAPTPNLDRLAKEGVVYTHNFSVSGVCSPSRATLATGLYPNSFGAQNMRTLSQQPAAREAGIIDYQAVPPPEVKMVSEIMRENGYYTTNNAKEDYQFFKSELAWDESSVFAHWRNRPNDETPFFSIFNAGVTHESSMWNSQPRQEDYEKFPPSRSLKNWWERRGYKTIEEYQKDTIPLQVAEDLAVEPPPYLPQNEIGKKAMRKLYSNMVRMDRFFGNILDQLEEDGLLEETIIVWYSDHGGPLPRQKRLMYDSGLRTPLIIRYPNKKRAGERDDRLISFVDFPPTLLSMVGIEPPSYMQGQAFEGRFKSKTPRTFIHGHADRFDESVDMIRAVRNRKFKYLKNFYPDRPYYLSLAYREKMDVMQELLRMRDAGELDENQSLWFRQTKAEEELFDTENDPHELNNIANDPAYADVLATLRAECERWMNAIDDKGFIDEIELINSFYPNGKAQLSEPPKIDIKGGRVFVSITDPGVRIGYRYATEKAPYKGWNIYTEPIEEKPEETLEIITHRLGYKYGITKVANGKSSKIFYPSNPHDKKPKKN